MSSKGKASNVVRFPIREFKTKVWIVANRILPYSTWDEEEPTPFDPDARQTPPFRAGKDSAAGKAIL